MSNLYFTGLGSGIDTDAMVTYLMELERLPLARVEAQKKNCGPGNHAGRRSAAGWLTWSGVSGSCSVTRFTGRRLPPSTGKDRSR